MVPASALPILRWGPGVRPDAPRPPAGERVWRLVWSPGAPCGPLLPGGAVALVPPHRGDWIEAAAAGGAVAEVGFSWPGSPPEQAHPWVRLPRSPDPSPELLRYLLWLGRARTENWQELAAQSLCMVLALLFEDDAARLAAPGQAASASAGAADGSGTRPELAAALRYIRETWQDGLRPLTLVELASAASVSRGHFARMFQAHFGIGAVTALEQVRLARAERLLAAGSLNVSQVARACGFTDPLHFSRRFRATHGLAPQVFRQDPDAAPRRCDGPAVRTLLQLTGV